MLTLALPLPWWLSHTGRQFLGDPTTFMFWHTAMALFAVVLALLVFVTGYRAILSARNGAVVLLGVAFLGVGLLDFLHALSQVGRPEAATHMSAPSLSFWLAAHLLPATSLRL